MLAILRVLEHLGGIIEIAFNQPLNPALVKLMHFQVQERIQLPVFVLIELHLQVKEQVPLKPAQQRQLPQLLQLLRTCLDQRRHFHKKL